MTTTEEEIAKRWFDLTHGDEQEDPLPPPFYDDGVGHEADDKALREGE